MIFHNHKEIKYAFLANAILCLEMIMKNRGHKFLSGYMDPKGECSLTFKGKLNEEDIKEVLLQFSSPYAEDYPPVTPNDYEYIKESDGEDATHVYTPDNMDLRADKIW